MSKNSKKIGNSYEREIAKKLSKWFTGNDDELVVWRNIHSGTVGTVRKKQGKSAKNVDGDFNCLDSTYEEFFNIFYMDSKSLTDINLFMINPSNKKSNKLLNEWMKVVDDAGDKIPLMFVKVRDDRKIPEFVVTTCMLLCKDNQSYIQYNFGEDIYKCYILLQDDFFNIDWKDYINFFKFIDSLY